MMNYWLMSSPQDSITAFTYLSMLLIHTCHLFIPAPSNLPHIYPFLYSVYSALNFGIIYIYMTGLHILLTYSIKRQEKDYFEVSKEKKKR